MTCKKQNIYNIKCVYTYTGRYREVDDQTQFQTIYELPWTDQIDDDPPGDGEAPKA